MYRPNTTGSITEDLKMFRNSRRKRSFDFSSVFRALFIVACLGCLFYFEYTLLGQMPDGLEAPWIRVGIVFISSAFSGWAIYRFITRIADGR